MNVMTFAALATSVDEICVQIVFCAPMVSFIRPQMARTAMCVTTEDSGHVPVAD